MKDIRELLQTRPLLFDGAMGTYYKAAPGVECEQANLTDPAGVLAVHREYLAAGADAVKTNTFSLPRLAAAHTPGWEQLAQAGWQLAVQAAEETGAAVFADLGPAPDTEAVPAGQVYTAVAKQFAALGARNFLFETLSSDAGLLDAVGAIKAEVPDALGLVSCAVLPGYTRGGMYCKDLARRMQESGIVDAVGLNCGSAPGAMRTLAKQLGGTLPLSVRLSRCHPDAGEVSGQAGVLCKGAGPSGRRGHGSDPGRLLRHHPRPHCRTAGGAGQPARGGKNDSGRRIFHREGTDGGKRGCFPA